MASTSSAPAAALPPRMDQIINATRVLFTRYGYRRTAMDDIAREAGVAKATLYLHFAGKDDVFRAMVARCRAVMDERCVAAEQMDGPVASRIAALLDANFGTALEWFGDASHMGELKALFADAPPPETSETSFRERIRRLLAGAVAAKELDLTASGLTVDAVARILVNAASGAKHARSHAPEKFRADLADITALTVAALKPKG